MEFQCDECYDKREKYVGGRLIPCPKCGGVKAVIEALNKDVDILSCDSLKIPEYYRGKFFDKSALESRLYNDREITDYQSYVGILNEVYSTICNRKIYPQSLLVYSPQGCGKDEWVYMCMQMCISSGLKTVPYLDSSEFDRMENFYRYNPGSKYIFDYTMDDFYTADYCFIKLISGVIKNRDVQYIKMLTDGRARKGLPTIIISNFPYEYLTQVEKTFERFCTVVPTSFGFDRPLYVPVKTAYKQKAGQSGYSRT